MTDVLFLLLFVPFVLAMLSFVFFRFLARNYRPRILAVIGIIWVSALIYWAFGQSAACKMPASGEGDNGCGFVSFLGPLEIASQSAAILMTFVCLAYWLYKAHRFHATGYHR